MEIEPINYKLNSFLPTMPLIDGQLHDEKVYIPLLTLTKTLVWLGLGHQGTSQNIVMSLPKGWE